MSYQLSIHERAAIERAFAMHHGRELTALPELVKVEEVDEPTGGTQAFNRDFALWFTDKPLGAIDRKPAVCDVLPNNIGPDLYLAVEPGTLSPLFAETLCLPAAPLSSYGPYVAQVQPWLHRCLSNAAGPDAHGAPDAWETLRRCVSDFSRFDMLRLMIIGHRMCFFGQVGARTTDRTMADAETFREHGRQLTIRVSASGALAIDGFADVAVVRTKDAIAWIRE